MVTSLVGRRVGNFLPFLISRRKYVREDKKMWWVIGLHLFFICSAYIILGAIANPWSARMEETFLGMVNFLIPITNSKRRNGL